jgi:anti-sigma B factor antagonist
MELNIQHPTEEIVLIQIGDKFTIEDVNIFKDKTAVLVKEPVKSILANFSGLDYIDSSGIGSLILLMNTAKNLNIEFIIYNIQNEILNVFKIAYLDKFFRIMAAQDLKKIFPGIAI